MVARYQLGDAGLGDLGRVLHRNRLCAMAMPLAAISLSSSRDVFAACRMVSASASTLMPTMLIESTSISKPSRIAKRRE